MSLFLALEFLHVLPVIVAVGANLTYAFAADAAAARRSAWCGVMVTKPF